MAPSPIFVHRRSLCCASRFSASASLHTIVSHRKKTKGTIVENEKLGKELGYHRRQTELLLQKNEKLVQENNEMHRRVLLVKEEFDSNQDGDGARHTATPISASSTTTTVKGALSTPGSEPDTVGVWKVLKQGDHSLDNSFITDAAWLVLRRLRERGYEAYLVGGSVRDMLLNKVPKDFDVLTTANLKQVQKSFVKTLVVGRRFPICHVTSSDKTVEVSSFSTSAKKKSGISRQASDTGSAVQRMKGLGSLSERDIARWENCLKRDFTINGLMYDPIKGVLYDYVGGIEDLRRMQVRTVIPADKSFDEDCARLLRAIRIAARLGLSVSRDIAHAIQSHRVSVKNLNKSRLMMEVNYMLAYGAAEASMHLLRRFGVLEILLPLQAAYFTSAGFTRGEKSSTILLKLLKNLDRTVAPDRPCHPSLWLGLLAVHLALADHPRSQVIISAFVLAMHSKKGVTRAVQKAKQLHSKYSSSEVLFPEIDKSECSNDIEIELEVWMLRDDVMDVLCMMHDGNFIRMQGYSDAQRSYGVLVSRNAINKCKELFHRIHDEQESQQRGMRKPFTPINYDALLRGDTDEVSFVFSRILMHTLYPPVHKKSKLNE